MQLDLTKLQSQMKDKDCIKSDTQDGKKSKAEWFLFIFISILILMYALFTEYDSGVNAQTDQSKSTQLEVQSKIQRLYPQFQDVNVMVFVGFGFLMTFLRSHCWTSVSYNLIISCLAILWTIFVNTHLATFVKKGTLETLKISLESLFVGEFGAATVLISFGAILGRTNFNQLVLMCLLEIVFYSLNEAIGIKLLKVTDIGGSMVVHTFGAYFGLAASLFFKSKSQKQQKQQKNVHNSSSYNSNLFASIGTIFLFMYWPSFNGALAKGDFQQRAFINTLLSITSSTISSCLVSKLLCDHKLDMEIVLNATLAGGVAIGSSADIINKPFVAIIIGILAGIVSAMGYLKLSERLKHKLMVNDTCGVHNLHGMPGIVGSICSIFVIISMESDYGQQNTKLFLNNFNDNVNKQALNQFLFLLITLCIAIIGGLVTGYICNHEYLEPLSNDDEQYQDHLHFKEVEYPQDYEYRPLVVSTNRNHNGQQILYTARTDNQLMSDRIVQNDRLDMEMVKVNECQQNK